MKGITGNSVLDAYQRMAVRPVDGPRAPQAVGGAEPGGHEQAATVSISTEARQLAGAERSMDVAKVESLKSSIGNGTYRVDAQAVARRMLGVSE